MGSVQTLAPALRVDRLVKSFGGARVVDDLSLRVELGEVVALVGANGAGKTTALRCIVGAEECDAGTVTLLDRPLDDADPETRRRLCALLDDFTWFPDLTVAEHLELYARAFDTDGSAALVGQAMVELGIAALADRLPGTLSSGQTRRFALAQALVRPWCLLVLDEPEQRLDVAGRRWLANYLRDSVADGRAVLLASHDPEVLADCGARALPVNHS